jgi:hypothetical protein
MSFAPLSPVDELLGDAPGVAGAVLTRRDPAQVAAWFEDASAARAVKILRVLDARTSARLLLAAERTRRAGIVHAPAPRHARCMRCRRGAADADRRASRRIAPRSQPRALRP